MSSKLEPDELMNVLMGHLIRGMTMGENSGKHIKKGANTVPLLDVISIEEFACEIEKNWMKLQERNKEVLETAFNLIDQTEDKER